MFFFPRKDRTRNFRKINEIFDTIGSSNETNRTTEAGELFFPDAARNLRKMANVMVGDITSRKKRHLVTIRNSKESGIFKLNERQFLIAFPNENQRCFQEQNTPITLPLKTT